jgi:hypothetical protein
VTGRRLTSAEVGPGVARRDDGRSWRRGLTPITRSGHKGARLGGAVGGLEPARFAESPAFAGLRRGAPGLDATPDALIEDQRVRDCCG